ncbi:MAG: GSCFA domain-containing protein [Flavitalea sp.]
MKLMLDIKIGKPEQRIDYRDKMLVCGSCFTEHIGSRLHDLKFAVLQNPNGIIFDPFTVATSITSYIDHKFFLEGDLVHLNELWQSWQHHSRFSGINKDEVLAAINESQEAAHHYLKDAKWLIITLGTSFSYRLVDGMKPVANCHRAPANWFQKQLMTIEEIQASLDTMLYKLFLFNKNIHVIFTVSPVRHIRDGLIENNRSKARLIESVHHLVGKYDRLFYFPSYELVIDVLRDYRFYDIDLVHPNYQATEYVLQQFMEHFINNESNTISKEIDKINIARKHRAFQPDTEAYKNFLKLQAERTRELLKTYPFIDLQEELDYFEGSSEC